MIGRLHVSSLAALCVFSIAAGSVASAQTAPAPNAEPVVLPDVDVVGSTPLLGSGVDRDQIPAATNVLDAKDISRSGDPSLTGGILESIPSATVNDVDSNVFQPDILFRGYAASPVAGTPEGLAVYVNGVRFNDAFGDTVNWDLIPSLAIRTVNVEASNPVFGLNALGGSVNVQLKNGFNSQGGSVTGMVGSYGRLSTSLEYGKQFGDFAYYFSGELTHDQGFRYTQESDIRRMFADFGWRGSSGETHFSILGADNVLGNPGAAPIQALQANIANIFTAPNSVTNKFIGFNLNGDYSLNSTNSVQTVAYFQNFNQKVPNGTTVEVAPCNDGSGLLCNDDGTYVTGLGGQLVPDFLNGGPYSGLSTQSLNSNSYGGSAQVTNTNPFGNMPNHLVVGASYDGSVSDFSGTSAIGGFDPITREYIGPGVIQDQPDEGVNPVKVQGASNAFGLYGQDILALTPALGLNLAGRLNYAHTGLDDLLGGPVNGQYTFVHFNPSAGLTYRFTPWLQVYGSYSVNNRVPTPQELSCSSAATPCSLLNFFVGDPPLKQVVANTYEVGARGAFDDVGPGRLSWNADYFHTVDDNDLIYEVTDYNPNLAYYTNAGRTQRQGVELNLHYDTKALHIGLGYAYTDAIYLTSLLLGSPSNPQADANGNEQVVPGDHIPGIPRHRATAVIDYDVTDRWTVGATAIAQSSQYYFGDEANLNPQLPGYFIVNAHTSYKITNNITAFALVDNAFDTRYYTYGTFGPVDEAPWSMPVTSNATAVPGLPFAVYGGVKVTF